MVSRPTLIDVRSERNTVAGTLEKLDHPLMFLFTISIGVAAVWALLGWGLAALGWTGPLGLFKGGVQ
jgi:hypothetical protein